MLLVAIAAAAPPLGSVELHGAPWFDQSSVGPEPVLGLRGGLLLAAHWEPGLVVDAGLGPRLAGRLDLRWLHGDVVHGKASAWLGATGGAWWDGQTVHPTAGPEVGVELPLGPIFVHLDATMLFGDVHAGVVGAGVGWRKRLPVPVPAPVAPVVVAAAPRSGTMVWIPHPWCEWIAVEDAADELAALPPGTRVRVVKPGFRPTEVDAAAAGSAELEPLPPQGSLTIAGAVTDRVTLSGLAARLGANGSLSTLAAEGVVKLHAAGGGRHVDQIIAVSSGRAFWVDLPDPEPLVLYFPVRSSALDAGSISTLGGFAADAGDWTFEVSGAASPEGDAAENEALATARAGVVRDTLIAAGLPEDRVRLVGSFVPDPALPLEEQRLARVVPVVPR